MQVQTAAESAPGSAGVENADQTGDQPSVRRLRFELAKALTRNAEETAGARGLEALSLLKQALEEEDGEPSDGRLHLTLGTVLERRGDSSGALRHFIAAASGDCVRDAVAQAKRLVLSSSPASGATVTVPTEAVEQLAELAPADETGDAARLAAFLFREQGRLTRAEDVLRRALDTAETPNPAVGADLAELLLDLDRAQDALSVADRVDPSNSDDSLALVRAKVALLDERPRDALSLFNRVWHSSREPSAGAARALCLLALDRADDAFAELPEGEDPDVQFARAVVALHRRAYEEAREASWLLTRSRPGDGAALLVDAQTTVEAIGSVPEAPEPDANASPAAGAEIDAARRLLSDALTELPAEGTRSFLWRAQELARRSSTRFRYFQIELRYAANLSLSPDELDGIAGPQTTWLQDAALAEIRAKLYRDAKDDERAAAAHDEACNIFMDYTPDPQRAYEHARDAAMRAPTAARASRFAYRAYEASLIPDLEPDLVLESVRAAVNEVKKWLGKATGSDLEALLHVQAWLAYRLGELGEESAEVRLPVMLAGVVARPTDGTLRALTTWDLSDLGYKAGAYLMARSALQWLPDDEYVLSTAMAANINYYNDRERVTELLEHPTLQANQGWMNTVDLHISLHRGDRDMMSTAIDRPQIDDEAWVQRLVALARAMLDGLDVARPLLESALVASADDLRARPQRALIAAAIGNIDLVQQLAHDAERDPMSTRRARLECASISRFMTDPSMTPDDYLLPQLDLAPSPLEVYSLVNVAVPILTAARSGDRGPIFALGFHHPRVAARLEELGEPRTRWEQELEGQEWAALARLALSGDEPAVLAEVLRGGAVAVDGLPADAVEYLIGTLIDTAAGELAVRLVDAREAGAPLPEEDVRALLDPSAGVTTTNQLVVALLTEPTEWTVKAMGRAGTDEAQIVDVADRISELVPMPDEPGRDELAARIRRLWMLDEMLSDAETATAREAGGSELAVRSRTRLIARLGELLGMNTQAEGDPPVNRIVFEVVEDLTGLVDNRIDPRFIHELIPEMRDRILSATGVPVPSVTARVGVSLGPNGFAVIIDDTTVRIGALPVGDSFTVGKLHDGGQSATGVLTIHPRTGEAGLWMVSAAPDGRTKDDRAAEDDAAQPLSRMDLLLHLFEESLRGHLDRLLTPDATEAMIDQWMLQDDEGLVAGVLPDDDARLRLTWVLQSVLGDGLPVSDWRTILRAIRDAGGIGEPVPALHDAVRAGLQAHLPGRAIDRQLVDVPPELEDALLGAAGPDSPAELRRAPVNEFRRWLHAVTGERGSGITLVVANDRARELVDLVARDENDLIATLSREEAVAWKA